MHIHKLINHVIVVLYVCREQKTQWDEQLFKQEETEKEYGWKLHRFFGLSLF